MKVLIACEESQMVCKAMRRLGHDAYSCDILPCSGGHPEWHIKGDVLRVLNPGTFRLENGDIINVLGWDLMIAHPPCTHLAVSGARWFTEGKKPWSLQEEALEFVRRLLNAPIKKIALENPVSVISTKIRKPDQIIQPYEYGHPYSKKTCLWLKNLPKLIPTKIVDKGESIIYKSGRAMLKWYADMWKLPKEERQKLRSKTYPGIAKAMAEQWTNMEVGGCNADYHKGIPPKTKVLGILELV
jgi:hypothetical protein